MEEQGHVSLRGVSVAYGPVHVFERLDLEVAQSEFTAERCGGRWLRFPNRVEYTPAVVRFLVARRTVASSPRRLPTGSADRRFPLCRKMERTSMTTHLRLPEA